MKLILWQIFRFVNNFCKIGELSFHNRRINPELFSSILPEMPLIKWFLYICILFHDIHDRTAMDDKCRLCHMAADTSGHNPVKSSQVSAFKPFPAFSSRKRQSTVAVNPFLIVRITFQLFIVLIFKLSEITFCQLFNNMYRLSRKKNLCCLHASFQRTYINRLNLWIIHLMQKLCSLLT